MPNSDFYRRQAKLMLWQAEQVEKLEKLRDLPAGTVITFEREANITLSYAAIAVDWSHSDARSPIPRWYLTGWDVDRKSGPLTVSQLIERLMQWDVTDIYVAARRVPLATYVAGLTSTESAEDRS